MNQRRRMNHLDDGGERMMSRCDASASMCRQKQKRWAKPLAAVMLDVRDEARDMAAMARQLARENPLHLGQIRDHGGRQLNRAAGRSLGSRRYDGHHNSSPPRKTPAVLNFQSWVNPMTLPRSRQA